MGWVYRSPDGDTIRDAWGAAMELMLADLREAHAEENAEGGPQDYGDAMLDTAHTLETKRHFLEGPWEVEVYGKTYSVRPTGDEYHLVIYWSEADGFTITAPALAAWMEGELDTVQANGFTN